MDNLIGAFKDKIKQDKLDQRRTVLSKIDQAFVDAVAVLAADADVELEASIQKVVSENPEASFEEEGTDGNGETADEDEYPELDKDVPKREALVAGGYTSDEEVQALSKKELIEVDEVGDVSAEKIVNFYEDNEES